MYYIIRDGYSVINEKDNTLMAATLLLESRISKYRIGYVPGSFLIDYNNDNLFKDFNATQLVNLSHSKGSPWYEIYSENDGKIPRNEIIDKIAITITFSSDLY